MLNTDIRSNSLILNCTEECNDQGAIAQALRARTSPSPRAMGLERCKIPSCKIPSGVHRYICASLEFSAIWILGMADTFMYLIFRGDAAKFPACRKNIHSLRILMRFK